MGDVPNVLKAGRKVDVANLFGVAHQARRMRSVAVRHGRQHYSVQVDQAMGTLGDLKEELQKLTNVRVKRQVLVGLENLPDHVRIGECPPQVMSAELVLEGDAAVSITDATDRSDVGKSDCRAVSDVTATKAGRHRSAAERSEEHRTKGNEHFRRANWDLALDYYTRAINALPDDVRALSNRAAVWAVMERFNESLYDADTAVHFDDRFAKAWSRKGFAHFHLKHYDESAAAYGKGLELDPENGDMIEGRAKAVKAGGDAKRAAEREAKLAKLKREQEQEELRKHGLEGKYKHLDAWARYEIQKKEHEDNVRQVRKERREAIEKWRTSTRLDQTDGIMHPETDRGRSVRIDIFGWLRGRCEKTGCNAWSRDIDKSFSWGNTVVLLCEGCGACNDDHENCGKFVVDDPKPPDPPGKEKKVQIDGVYDGSGFNGKDFGDKTEERMNQSGTSMDCLWQGNGEVGKANGAPVPKGSVANAQTFTAKEIKGSSPSIKVEMPPNCDVMSNIRGGCEDCGPEKCACYIRPVRGKTDAEESAGIMINPNDATMLLCAGCGCDVSKHTFVGKWDPFEA